MKVLNVTKRIGIGICMLGFVFLASHVSADIVINDFYDLNDTAAPTEPPPGWTFRTGSGGSRSGTAITAPTGGEQFFVYSAVGSGEISIDDSQAWMIEAVLSAVGIATPGEAGARMLVTFKEPALFNSPPPFIDKYRRVEVRLLEVVGGVRRVVLWSRFTSTNPAGEQVLSLDVNWAKQPPGDHRYRIRLKRQRIDTGTVEDYIILQAEASRRPSPSDEPWWDDPESPWADSVPAGPDADPPHRYSRRVLVSELGYNTAGGSEIGFGHTNNGTDKDVSIWENIHVTIADDADTILPYWPPEPPAPVLTLTTTESPHEVSSQIDLPIGAYLVNDAATVVLDTLSGQLSSTPIPDPSASPAQHIETFAGLDGDQTVTGWVEVADDSRRTSTGTAAGMEIPPDPENSLIEISPLEYDFGNITVGDSATTIITIQNENDPTLTITGITLNGTSDPDFSITSAPALPKYLDGSGESSAEVEITFAPSTEGDKNASLVIQSDDSINPVMTVPLSGEGVEDENQTPGDGNGSGGCFMSSVF